MKRSELRVGQRVYVQQGKYGTRREGYILATTPHVIAHDYADAKNKYGRRIVTRRYATPKTGSYQGTLYPVAVRPHGYGRSMDLDRWDLECQAGRDLHDADALDARDAARKEAEAAYAAQKQAEREANAPRVVAANLLLVNSGVHDPDSRWQPTYFRDHNGTVHLTLDQFEQLVKHVVGHVTSIEYGGVA